MKSPSNGALKWVVLAWDHTHRSMDRTPRMQNGNQEEEVRKDTT